MPVGAVRAPVSGLTFPADSETLERIRGRRRLLAGITLVLAIVLAILAGWSLMEAYRTGAHLLESWSLLIAAALTFGFAYGMSLFGAFYVRNGVMTLEFPIYLGKGRRIRHLALADIAYVEEDPDGSHDIKARIVLKDGAFFWISSSGLPEGGASFLRLLVTSFPRRDA